MNPQNKQPRIEVICVCGEKFETTQNNLDKGRGKFCSKKCQYANATRKKFGKGVYKIVAENKGWLKKGHTGWNKGKAGTYKNGPILNRKGIQNNPGTQFKKGETPWNKGKKFEEISGEKHHNWMGDEVGYQGVHRWVNIVLGKPAICSRCPELNAKRYEWHNKSGEYKRDVSDWERLCSKCHRAEHRKNGSLRKK